MWVPPSLLALSWSSQLALALEHLHGGDEPIAHSDVKLANLLVTADLQTLKLTDFSVSMPVSSQDFAFSRKLGTRNRTPARVRRNLRSRLSLR